jgi:transposase InsO family protein
MTKKITRSISTAWAHFRFSVVGSLLSAPPARGELQAAIAALAEKQWIHPTTEQPVQFSAVTIERWYYLARRENDNPVDVLRRSVRKDAGRSALADCWAEQLQAQYRQHPYWSYQLHYDNLKALVKAHPDWETLGSYSTIRRYMKAHDMVRKREQRKNQRPGEVLAARRRESRAIRSYEAEYVGSLWHLDFHHGSLKVRTPRGPWQRPIALGILDDHSRLCCHLQWYLSETAEDLVHGLSQAIQKRGLPRALMTDNGPAMVADEVTQGLLRLSIVHEKTLPYSPYQNGKQEAFWVPLEGRLMKMLEGQQLTLEFLNQATQAWTEIEYNRASHREISAAPIERWKDAPSVLRSSPSSNELRDAFRIETERKQRRSDGTILLEGVRFEIPTRFRHFRQLVVRYARWDLSRVDLVDPKSGIILAPIFPLDRTANADGRRGVLEPESNSASDDTSADDESLFRPLPPLLKRILDEYEAGGSPPNYLPKNSDASSTPPTPKDPPNDSQKGTNL